LDSSPYIYVKRKKKQKKRKGREKRGTGEERGNGKGGDPFSSVVKIGGAGEEE
jgi:hypothetical protein